MRTVASFLAPLALIAVAQLPLPAQRADSALVGRWTGRAELASPATQQRELTVELVVHVDGVVSGRIGDALLAGAHLYRDNRVARALGLARQFLIEGHLYGPVIRSESVSRELVRLSLDRVGDQLTGSLQTSGSYEGEPGDPMLTGKISLARAKPVVELAGKAIAAPLHSIP
jgi:hypothetical protein